MHISPFMTVLFIIAAVMVAGCEGMEDFGINNPDDLAGRTHDNTPQPSAKATPGPTLSPTATINPTDRPLSVSNVLAEWNKWFVTQLDMDNQVSGTMKLNSKLDNVLFLSVMKSPDYDKYITDTRSVSTSASDWSGTLSLLSKQRYSFDETRSLLSYDILVSSDADRYAAEMSVEMSKYEDCINTAKSILISYCNYQEAYIKSGKSGQLDETLLRKANEELKQANAKIDEANDHWCQACYRATQLESLA